jgi:hypothetical protein
MSTKTVRRLWVFTGLVAVFLVVVTVYLAREEKAKEEAGYSAYIVGLNSVIYLREHPDPTSYIVTILDLGQQVFVTDISDVAAVPWARVRTGSFEGWVPAERIGEQPP